MRAMKHTGAAGVIAVVLGLLAPMATAANLWWDGGAVDIVTDGNGASAGSNGTWNTATLNWDAGAAPHVAWDNGNNDTAIFGGTAGTVTLAAPLTVGGLVFTTANYVLTNSILTFGAAGTISNAAAATIYSTLAGNDGLTKAGAGTLMLSGSNTFSGDIIMNAGMLDGVSAAALGPGSNITFAGSGTLQPLYDSAQIGSVLAKSVTVNPGVTAHFAVPTQYFRITFVNPVAGGGTLMVDGGNNNGVVAFSSPANTFTGVVRVGSAGAGGTFSVNSLVDSANPIQMNAGSFQLGGGVATPLVFNNRRIELTGTTTGPTINNYNGTVANTITISTDLSIVGVGAKTLTLGGSNTGLNRFAGAITNAPGSVISVTKAGAGTWALAATNTYTGTTTVSGGTLVFQGKAALPTNSAISVTAASTTRFLDDGAGIVDLGNNLSGGNNFTVTLFVGNNDIANGGSNSGSATTNSTITLGVYSFVEHTDVYDRTLSITGANGYRLRLGGVSLFTQGGQVYDGVRTAGNISPSTAPVTVNGTVIQRNGKSTVDPARRAYQDYFTLDGAATGNLVSGVIMDALDYTSGSNVNATAMNVLKRGAGEWSLSSTNLYSGETRLVGGSLIVNHLANSGVACSLGSSSSAAGLVLAGGTLMYAPIDGVGGAGVTIDRNLAVLGGTLAASGTGALVFSAPADGGVSPDVTGLGGAWASGSTTVSNLTSTLNLTVGMRAKGTGIVGGQTISSINGSTRITLSAATTAAGSGDVAFGYPARTLTLAGTSTNDNTIAGILQDSTATGTNALGVTKSGTGTWVLTGSNTFTGALTLNAGTLVLDGAGGAISPAALVTLNGGTLALRGGATPVLGNMTNLVGAASRLVLGAGVTLGMGSTWGRAVGSSLVIDLSAGGTLTAAPATANGIVTGSGGAAFVVVSDGVGTGFATVSGGNVVRYLDASALASGSNDGTANYKASGSLTMTSTNRSVNSLELDTSGGDGVLDLGGPSNVLTITSRGLLVTGLNGFTVQNGQVGAANAELIVHQYADGPLTISGRIGSGSTTLTKAGPGRLVLSGANTYTGTTYLDQGVLNLRNNTAAGTAAGGIVVANGAALELEGGAAVGAEALSLTGTGVSEGGALRNVSGDNTYGGTISLGVGGARINADSGSLTLGGGIVTAAGRDATVGGVGAVTVRSVISGPGG